MATISGPADGVTASDREPSTVTAGAVPCRPNEPRIRVLRVGEGAAAALAMGALLLSLSSLSSCRTSDPPDPAQLQLSEHAVPCVDRGPFAGRVEIRVAGETVEPAGLRLETTPYPDGFERGRFATASLVRQDSPFRVDSPQGAAPPLDHLVLSSISGGADQGVLSIQVTGLEAGVGYDFRIAIRDGARWKPGTAIRVDAPTCFGDPR